MTTPHLEARYSSSGGVDLAGSREDLLLLEDSLNFSTEEFSLSLIEPAMGPAPYDISLVELSVVATSGKLVVAVAGDKLMFSGGPRELQTLASNIGWFAREGDQLDELEHLHIEHLPGCDHYIAAESEPLVVSFLRSSGP